MPTPMEYALMAGNAYLSTRRDINQIPFPAGWTPLPGNLGHQIINAFGFEVTAYQNGNEIVISYAGTYTGQLQDFLSNALLGLGIPDGQLIAAALFYEQVKAAYPDAQISFTGHSLGGGLASLMGVFFDKPATTFDPAPFRMSATTSNRNLLIGAIAGAGFGADSDLNSFTSNETDVPGPVNLVTDIRGEGNVTMYAVDGEFLTWTPGSNALRIGAFAPGQPLAQGWDPGLSSSGYGHRVSDLHSIALLILLQGSESFRQLTFSLPTLLPSLFNPRLFATDTSTDNPSILEHLVRHQFGVDGVGRRRIVSDVRRLRTCQF